MLKKFAQSPRPRDTQSPQPGPSVTTNSATTSPAINNLSPSNGVPPQVSRCRSIPSSELLADLAEKDLPYLPPNLFNHLHITSLDLRHNRLGDGLRDPTTRVTDPENPKVEKGLKDLNIFTRLTRLNLANNGLKALPPEIGQLGTLIVLNITGNELTELPPQIGQLGRLQRLHADFNNLSTIPEEIGELAPNLTHLTLNFNRFTHLIPTLVRLTSLQSLMLKANYLESLETEVLRGLKSLRSLDVRGNKLTGKLRLNDIQLLEVLNLSRNSIEDLELVAVKKLHTLDCSRCRLSSLILDSQCLKILIANNNTLKTIALTGSSSSLHAVNISHNLIDALPEWIYQSPELFTLNASHNKIKQCFERVFKISTLDTVNFSHNHLRSLPAMANPSSVRKLYLQNNRISNLQDNIFQVFGKLEEFNISYNQLTSFPNIGSSVHGQLLELHLSGNGVNTESLHQISTAFPNLKKLTLAYNKLECLPESAVDRLSHLTELSVSGNLLKKLPCNLPVMTQLKTLRANSNLLQMLPSLSGMSSLEVLDISCNRIQKLPLTPLVSSKLCHLDISCNVDLHVDSDEFKKLCSGKAVAFIDSCCLGRKTPATNKKKSPVDRPCTRCPWRIGFTESQSGQSRITIDQKPSSQELLIAVIENSKEGSRVVLPSSILSQLFDLETRKNSSSPVDVMKAVYLTISNYLRTRGASLDTSLLLCHIIACNSGFNLRVASDGKNHCLITSKGKALEIPTGIKPLLSSDSDWLTSVQAGFFTDSSKQTLPVRFLPKTSTDVLVVETSLGPDDVHLILGSSTLWDSVNLDLLFKEIRKDKSPSEISKRLFEAVAPEVSSGEDLCIGVIRLLASGNRITLHLNEHNDPGSIDVEVGSQASDLESVGDGEKYKCWEYMLEQNHKLLFTKELETINKSILKTAKQRAHAADLGKQMAMQSFTQVPSVMPVVPIVPLVPKYSPLPVQHRFYHFAGCHFPSPIALRSQVL